MIRQFPVFTRTGLRPFDLTGVVPRRVFIPRAYTPSFKPYTKAGVFGEVAGEVHDTQVVLLDGLDGGLRMTRNAVNCLPSEGLPGGDITGALERLDMFDRLADGLVGVGTVSLALSEVALEASGFDQMLTGGISMAQRGHSLRWDAPFTYHCKGASGGVKRALDTRDSSIASFFGANPHCPARSFPQHGEKVLTPFGSAVFLGLARPEKEGDMWVPMWHPSGSPYGAPWPMGHAFCLGGGCGMVSLGKVDVELNGPSLHSSHSVEEDLSRYLHTTQAVEAVSPCGGRYSVDVDATSWLARGMFGVEVGSPLPAAGHLIALGVGVRPAGVDQCAPLIDLYAKDGRTGNVVSASLSLAL